jgi:hypothetical protein
VTAPTAPLLDGRDAATVLAALLRRLPAYVPGWQPPAAGASQALLRVAARFREVLGERLDGVPRKELLAFLDFFGESLVEARAARAPVVFHFTPPAPPTLPALPPVPGLNVPAPPQPLALPVINIRAPAGTQVTAKAPDGTQLAYETEQAIALAAAKLAQVATLWPGEDTWTDFSAAQAAGRSFTLFASAGLMPHHLYLAHDALFALSGSCTVQLQFDLLTPSSIALAIAWEYWDGQGWHAFGDPDLKPSSNPPSDDTSDPAVTAPPGTVQDATAGLTHGGVVTLTADCVDNEKTAVNGVTAYWLRGRLNQPLPPDLSRQDALVKRVRVNTVVQRLFTPHGLDAITSVDDLKTTLGANPPVGLKPDQAFNDGTSLDLSKAVYPFGPAPQPGSTFVLSSEEVFSKSAAVVRLAVKVAFGPLGGIKVSDTGLQIAWEYWDGRRWAPLDVASVLVGGSAAADFTAADIYGFVLPNDGIPPSKLNGKDGRWVRARVAAGGYFAQRQISVQGPPTGTPPTPSTTTLTIIENHPPLLADVRLAYVYRSPRALPQRCLTFNDFAYEDHAADLSAPTLGFAAFRAVADVTPALYLGFDKALPIDLVSLFLDIQEQEETTDGPPLTWEYWDGADWVELAVQDDTARLVRPGMLAFVGPADAAALARFGTPLNWLRGRLRTDGTPARSNFNGVYLNAVWADQAATVRNEALGSGSGEPSQSFFLAHTPVLDGEVIEVRELDGPRAAVELPILAREVPAADLHVVTGANGVVQEVWVRWHGRPSFFASGPDDRDYVLERTQGRLVFGDGVNGRQLPASTDNVVAREYRWGGGAAGNVAAGAITQLMGGIPYVSGVTNPHAAEGGADGETLDEAAVRGPQALRHRGRALSAADYESLAQEASPGVAVARALPATDPSGHPAPGWVKLIIVPNSQDPRPQPSFGLRQQVLQYLQQRAPAGLTGVFVTGPTYLPVGVSALVAPLDASQAGPVGVGVRQALDAFFQPLTGGPDGQGWPFGRDVFLSDVAALLVSLPGVDYVQELGLLLDGIPQGEQVAVPPDRIVAAGAMRIRLLA